MASEGNVAGPSAYANLKSESNTNNSQNAPPLSVSTFPDEMPAATWSHIFQTFRAQSKLQVEQLHVLFARAVLDEMLLPKLSRCVRHPQGVLELERLLRLELLQQHLKVLEGTLPERLTT